VVGVAVGGFVTLLITNVRLVLGVITEERDILT
jgi:hypothetical protein